MGHSDRPTCHCGREPGPLSFEIDDVIDRANREKVLLGELPFGVVDFGTGYSSLSYLRKFPIDALKIDQSFVRRITTAPDETTIVTAVIGMARSLKLRVVAEGVETLKELEFLQAHQCDEAQGYYFGRPIVAEQFAKLLETGISETLRR